MISFIVPAFNEGEAIRLTVETIRSVAATYDLVGYEIIPIDDGSEDNSKEIMEQLAQEDSRIRPVYHPENKGLGRSIVDGIHKAVNPQFIVVPGDNDISTESLSLMLHFKDEAEIILTVPLNKEARPIGRQVISMIYQMMHNIFFGTSVGYLNGPGIWPTEKVKALDLMSNRFSIISEMNVKLLTKGFEFAEVPMYLQADEPTRATVTLRNMLEVIKVFMMLVVELNLKPGRPEKKPLNRVKIHFGR
ncbi:glycosyltransferase family 2 protein [Sneathiella sp.]|jgi:glycosyltransferase involved in cell wall biosynthesis|uniref:glycosyltransferase family 2 protein n=1 Tax=Sneathiella sp. TaxID=1964365 RepID=UPI0039E24A28